MSTKWQWDSATTTWLYFSLQPQVHLIAPWGNVKRQRYVNWYLCHEGLGLCFSLQHTCSTLLSPHMIGRYNHKGSLKLEKHNIFQVARDGMFPVLSNASSHAQMSRGGWLGCSSPEDLLSPLILYQGPGKAWLSPAGTAMLDVPLCELSLVAVATSRSPAQCSSRSCRDACSGCGHRLCWKWGSTKQHQSWPRWKPSSPAGLTAMLRASATRGNAHYSLCLWAAL